MRKDGVFNEVLTMHPPSNTSSGRRGELPVPDASTGQGPGGVRLSRGRRSSGFEGKCAYGLRKPRKECGGALRGLDAHPMPETADVRGTRRGELLAGAGLVRRRLAARGCGHVGPMNRLIRLIWIFNLFFSLIIKHYCRSTNHGASQGPRHGTT